LAGVDNLGKHLKQYHEEKSQINPLTFHPESVSIFIQQSRNGFTVPHPAVFLDGVNTLLLVVFYG
jgi:hypothetical protein